MSRLQRHLRRNEIAEGVRKSPVDVDNCCFPSISTTARRTVALRHRPLLSQRPCLALPVAPSYLTQIRPKLQVLHSLPLRSAALTTSPTADPAPPDSLTLLWKDAVARYEKATGSSLSARSTQSFDSADAIVNYIKQHEERFTKFRKDGSLSMLHRFGPLAAILRTLCTTAGEGTGVVRMRVSVIATQI